MMRSSAFVLVLPVILWTVFFLPATAEDVAYFEQNGVEISEGDPLIKGETSGEVVSTWKIS